MPPKPPIHSPTEQPVNVHTPPAPPKTPNPTTGKIEYNAGVVDIEDLIDAQSRDLADHRMAESKADRSGNWIARTTKRIWTHNLFQTYFREKEKQNIRKEINRTGDFLAGEDGYVAPVSGSSVYLDKNSDSNKAVLAVVGRFTSEYEEDNLLEEERNSKAANSRNIPRIKDLIDRYATTPGMTPAQFEAERRVILSGEIGRDFTKNEARYADNFFKIATEIRDAITQGQNITDFDVKTNVIIGKARESLKSQENKTTFEKSWGWIKDSKLGQIVGNEAVTQLIGAGIFSIGKLGVGTAKSKLFQWLTGAATGGLTMVGSAAIAGANENLRLNRERGQHHRDLAKGRRFTEADMKRRQEMQDSSYETRNAKDMIAVLEQDLSQISNAARTPAHINSVIANLAELESRIRLANRHNINLVAYTHPSQVEIERARLGDLLGELKKQLVTLGHSRPSLEPAISARMDQLMGGAGGIEEKNRTFNTMKTKKIAMRVATTVAFGALAQEAIGTAGEIYKSTHGGYNGPETLLGDAYKHFIHRGDPKGSDIGLNKQATTADSLVRWLFEGKPRLPFGHGHEVIFDGNHIQLPDGSDMIKNGDGTFNILVGGKVVGDHMPLKFDPATGGFTKATKDLLAKQDIFPDVVQVKSTMTPSEYFKKHPEGTAKVHFNHLDNDTKSFDKNELRADLIKKNGKYYFDMHRMKDAKWIPTHDEIVTDPNPVTPTNPPITPPTHVEQPVHVKTFRSAEDIKYTVDERRLMSSVADQAMKNRLGHYFPKHGFLGLGRHGLHSPNWKFISEQPADDFIKEHFDPGTPYANMQNDLNHYINDLHLKPPAPGQSLEDYFKHVEEMRAGQIISNANMQEGPQDFNKNGLFADNDDPSNGGVGSDHSGRVLSKLDRSGDLGGVHSGLWKEIKNDDALDFLSNKPVLTADPESQAKLDLWNDMKRTIWEAHAHLPAQGTTLKDYLNHINTLKKDAWDNSNVTENLNRLRNGENLIIKAPIMDQVVNPNPISNPTSGIVKNPILTPAPAPHTHVVHVKGHFADPQSYKGTHYQNPHEEMLKGHIKTLFSVSRDVQHNPIMVDTDENGLAQVPDKFAYLIHEDANGHLTSHFKFVQIALPTEDLGNNEYNMDILATDPGKGIDGVEDSVAEIKLSLPSESEMILPGVFLNKRRPLERGTNRTLVRTAAGPQVTAATGPGPQVAATTGPGPKNAQPVVFSKKEAVSLIKNIDVPTKSPVQQQLITEAVRKAITGKTLVSSEKISNAVYFAIDAVPQDISSIVANVKNVVVSTGGRIPAEQAKTVAAAVLASVLYPVGSIPLSDKKSLKRELLKVL